MKHSHLKSHFQAAFCWSVLQIHEHEPIEKLKLKLNAVWSQPIKMRHEYEGIFGAIVLNACDSGICSCTE